MAYGQYAAFARPDRCEIKMAVPSPVWCRYNGGLGAVTRWEITRGEKAMSGRLICHGCGQLLPLPEGYRRNKIQCACGVICEVTDAHRAAAAALPAPPTRAPSEARKQPSPRIEEEHWAADFLSTPDEPARAPEEDGLPGLQPLEDKPSARREAPKRRERPRSEPVEEQPKSDARDRDRDRRADEEEYDGRPPPVRQRPTEMKFPCRRCRRLIARQGECPYCAQDEEDGGLENLDLSLDEPSAEDSEDDSRPYVLDGGNDVSCPKCTMQLPPGSVFCTRCGYDFRRKKKAVKTYQPLARAWETNFSLARRRSIYVVVQVLGLALGLTFNLLSNEPDWMAFVGSTLLFAAMTAFLLGTFDRIELRRDQKGRVTVTKLRRYCFILAPEKRIEIRGFEGVVTGRTSEVSGWEWIVFAILLLSGIIPGLVWWYYVIHKITFQVALAQDHGHVAEIVYRGWNEEQMHDIQRVLCDASGLRHLT
jgi:hypothetical protein